MPQIRVQIVRFVDEDPQPGIVEAQFQDAHGKVQSVIDKVPLFITADLWSDSKYPQPGFMECRVLKRVTGPSGKLAHVKTIESIDGKSEFLINEANLTEMTPFIYGGFWDVPRCLALRYRGKRFLFLSTFDEEIDEYPSDYSVYVIPESAEDSRQVLSPEFLSNTPMDCIGRIPIDRVTFDSTKRRELDASILDSLI
jgi:hypothetical protein